ncbi:MAG: hypothetical protein ACI9XZ_004678 [Alphaproteobacteria bacterium]|jgi:hypothetical protein
MSMLQDIETGPSDVFLSLAGHTVARAPIGN